jgi:hypothetical protein
MQKRVKTVIAKTHAQNIAPYVLSKTKQRTR